MTDYIAGGAVLIGAAGILATLWLTSPKLPKHARPMTRHRVRFIAEQLLGKEKYKTWSLYQDEQGLSPKLRRRSMRRWDRSERPFRGPRIW